MCVCVCVCVCVREKVRERRARELEGEALGSVICEYGRCVPIRIYEGGSSIYVTDDLPLRRGARKPPACRAGKHRAFRRHFPRSTTVAPPHRDRIVRRSVVDLR